MGNELRQALPRSLSRRHFIGGVLGIGGGLLLAACGGGATPTMPSTIVATAAPTSPPAASTPTTTVGVTAARPTGTATRIATPGRASATPARASATPGERLGNEFLRMLALVPQVAPLPGLEGVAFADVARQKRNYGLEGAISAAEFRALGISPATLTNAVAGLPLPSEAGVERALDPAWPTALGYDFWQIERTIAAGSPPGTWTRLEGRFDRAAIEAALTAAGHRPTTYGGATILSRGADAQIVNPDQPISRLTLAGLNRVVLGDGALTATRYTALAQAGIDTGAGRAPSFAADPAYVALAAALGAVVGARLLPADDFYRQAATNPRVTPALATAIATRAADPNRPRLHPYGLVGLGLRDDGKAHTMVIGLHYASAADARADAPLLRQRAADYVLLANRQPLRERAVAGEPEFTSTGAGATLVLPLAIAEAPNLGLWQQMFFRRDYAFLAE